MRYILDNEGYVELCSETRIECNGRGCTEYTGKVPTGYSSLKDWANNANIRAYKIVDGNLVFDANRDYKLRILFDEESNKNGLVTRKELGMSSVEEINPYTDLYPSKKSAGGYITSLSETFNKVGNLPTEEVNLSLLEEQDLDLIELEFIGNNFLPNNATSSVNSGISYTQNKDKTINVRGTATDRSTLNLAGTDTSVRNVLTFKANEKYLLFGLEGVSLEFYHYDGSDRTLVGIYNGGVISFEQDINVTQVVLVVDKGTTIDTTIKPMLQLVGLKHPIMPMTKYKGNLLKPYRETYTNREITFTSTNKGFVVNGTIPSSYQQSNATLFYGDLASGTYTINGISGASNSTYQLDVRIDGVTKRYLTTSSYTFTLTKTSKVELVLYVYSNYGTFNNLLLPYQLEGGTKVTEYKEYNGRNGQYYADGVSTQEVRSGKNSFNKANANYLSGYILNDSGTKTTDTTGGYTQGFTEIEPNETYTISGFSSSKTKRIYFYDGNKNFISRTGGYTGVNEFTFTTLANAKYIQIQSGNDETFNNTQLEKGSTATEYEAYGVAPSPAYPSEIINIYKAGTYNAIADNKIYTFTIPEDLRGLPNGVADRLWIDVNGDNGIDIEKKVGRVVLNGSETWGINNTGGYSTNPYFKTDYPGMVQYTNSLLSNYFQSKNISSSTKNAVQTTTNGILLQPSNGIIKVDDFKTWLSTHNTVVQFELATYTTSYIPSFSLEEFEYEEYKNNTTLIDLAGNEFTVADEITIKDNQIILIKDNKEIYLGDTVMPRTYTPYTHAYCHQKVYLWFRYKDPRNVDITKITLKGLLSITDIETEYNFNSSDLTKVQNYIMETGTLTDEEIELYDINGDGVITSYDYVMIRNMINGAISNKITGTLEINSTKSQRTIVLRDSSGKIQTSLGLNGITTPSLSCESFVLNGVEQPQIMSGTSLPEEVTEGAVFLLYDE